MENTISEPKVDSWHLYGQMLRCRLFEKEVARLWHDGVISGEMHLSMGEEAVVAGIVDQLVDGDALALDHRGTAPMLVRGVDPVALLREFMGRADGLCGGMGGHMHLFSQAHMAASSGIVGASAPAAVGFALANQRLRPGKISVAFFGEGAVNQGMVLEAFNLAVVWKLPVMFVCKDNDQAVATQSSKVTGGKFRDRALGFGLYAIEVDGSDVESVWNKVNFEMKRMRNGEGPVFVHAYCPHLEGHFLGDPLLRYSHLSLSGLTMFIPIVKALIQSKGAPFRERTESLNGLLAIIRETNRKYRLQEGDPIPPMRNRLSSMDAEKLQAVENQVKIEMEMVFKQAPEFVALTEGVGL